MLRVLFTLVVLSMPAVAMAAGQDVNWDDCVATFPNVKHFACDRNTGFDTLVGSFEPYVDVPDVIGVEVALDLQFQAGIVPSWWQVDFAGCRRGGLSASATFSATQTACTDPWQSQAVVSPVSAISGFNGNPARLRLMLSVAVSPPYAFAAHNGTVYYAYQMQIRRNSTIGPGACSGCDDPAIVVPSYTRVMTANSGDMYITTAISSYWLCWQCDCGYGDGGIFFGSCQATAVPNHTWGGIKSLYR